MQIEFDRLHIVFKGPAPRVGHAAHGARLFAFEGLFDGYVVGFAQFVDLYTQVARCGLRLLFQINEVGFDRTHQNTDNGQPQLRVQQGIELFHFLTLYLWLR